ncbi:polysaccharide biosynthesis/export family protein [Roseovarius nanhaiticus]|uniref:polysaccharide biosynthesis/export family protein n=1 Tax=Roseovarius nanhaiticus TaxID=573024 RepID=UPI00248FC2E8|nr:polysaccharide biosynthesis/export family protein [Roseovarius nanhaiticus]
MIVEAKEQARGLIAALRWAALCLAVLTVPACSLPRGAAITSEILDAERAEIGAYQVVRVSRANAAAIATWPRTATQTHYAWPPASAGARGTAIRAGDVLSLAIWDSQDNSLLTEPGARSVEIPRMTVSPEGTIFVPYLDEINVSGKPPAEARRLLQDRLGSIAPSAQVQLERVAGARNSVDLVSGVASPGSYPLQDGPLRILSAIAQGGGIAPGLRHPLVRLQRGGRSYTIRAERLLDHAPLNIPLRGGDVIALLEDERSFTAFGATGTEQLIRFEQEEITAMEALSLIGGLSEGRANPKGVLVLRDYGHETLRSDGTGPSRRQVVFAFDMTSADGLFAARRFRIAPGDTVMATESPVTSVRTVLGLVGSAFGVASGVQNY